MKNNLKTILFATLTALSVVGCVGDDDTVLPPYDVLPLSQDFEVGLDNTPLVTEGWVNYAQVGKTIWTKQIYSSNGYAEFNTYQSGDVSNIGWLVSPEFTLPNGNSRKLKFDSAQSYVTSPDNKLEVFISSNFDGTNVTAATWEPLKANIPGTSAKYFEFMNSGDIDLSAYSGPLHVAFRVTGSGTNASLDGTYQVDNVTIY
jgi:hypothetical protein